MANNSTVLTIVAYASLLVGLLFGLITIRLVVAAVSGTPVPAVAVTANLGVALLALFIGWMIRLANRQPSVGGSQSVRDKWKQW